MTTVTPTFDFSSLSIDAIKADAEALQQQARAGRESKGLFTVIPASKWLENASKKPIPRMLFSEFWHEGELCILFADSNLGKSILAVQIGESICTGTPIRGFKLEAQPQQILYFDFELSEKQFEARYSKDFQQHYPFSLNFYRAEINPDTTDAFQDFEDFLNRSLEQSIIETGAKILIIDNLTYLRNETERAKDALPLMKHLKALKAKYGLSILALAHTPKRDLSKPITCNDLQGSKMLYNFVDSCFAIGASHKDKSARYLKQIKQRHTEQVFDGENVCLCQIAKPGNFLQFEFIGFTAEAEHLKEHTKKDKEATILQAKELSAQGHSQRQIAAQLSISLGAVNKYLKQ